MAYIYSAGPSNNARNLTAETTNNETTTKTINLSRKRLTDSEQKILEKGLKFTPTPEQGNQQELKEDIFEFTKKITISRIFLWHRRPRYFSRLKNKSDFIPPRNRNAALDRYI